ncbi:MAG: histone deacetylase superfamily [Marmoricola sp.]|nr:histone deacetylase superfamily [Marmoricola sp.]
MDETTCRACVVYDQSLTSYDFGSSHPMNPVRVDLTISLAEQLGVLKQLSRVPAPTRPRTTWRPCTIPP